MINAHESVLAQALLFLKSHSELTPEQLTALKDELTLDPEGRGYKGAPTVDILDKLTSKYTKANPDAQTKIRRTWYEDPKYLEVFLTRFKRQDGLDYMTAIDLMEKSTDVTTSAVGCKIKRVLGWQRIYTEDTELESELTQLVAAGVLPQEFLTELLYVDDPEYRSTITMPSRSDVLFGTGNIPEITEIEEALLS